MKILFLCTSYNSLSQSVYLALSTQHDITIEYALSEKVMIEAVELAKPDLILCPFLTCKVPQEIYSKILTLIIHPGPPGDAGPSALDWVLMGDTGEIEDADQVLEALDHGEMQAGRSHWGVTVLQAIEQFDAGPVWAFEQFPIYIDQPELTKSDLYRGSVTQAAIKASISAIDRIHRAVTKNISPRTSSELLTSASSIKLNPGAISPSLEASPSYRLLSVTTLATFQGGKTRHRPLLPAKKRDFDPSRHTAQQISRRIRCGDSQPGVLSKVFGQALYIYGGIVEEGFGIARPIAPPGSIVAARNEAVCIATCDGRGIWITNIRRPKRSVDKALWPKVPAVMCLTELGILDAMKAQRLQWAAPRDWSLSSVSTFQEVWIDFVPGTNGKTAYLYFNFYNGAMTTKQCSQLVEAMEYILASSTPTSPVKALVMMGGNYFSNGIALNVIEADASPAASGWMNINRIDDVVQYLLQEMPKRNILTIAGIRGNAAAGGVAFAAACDIVIAGANVVLNPAYRSMGLHGSEYHSLSYFGRCGHEVGTQLLREMLPMSAFQALACGLVDHVLPGQGPTLDAQIRAHVNGIVASPQANILTWKRGIDLSPEILATARVTELAEMSKDFFSLRAERFHTRRFAFIRKCKASRTPFRFAKHRRFPIGEEKRLGLGELDEEERDDFDDVKTLEWFLEKEREKIWSAQVRSFPRTNSVGGSTLADGDRPSPDLGSDNGSEKNAAIVLRTVADKTWVKVSEKESSVVDGKDMTPIFSCYYTPPLEAEVSVA
ncbi:hydrogenase maturation factor hoxX like protein [Venturia nashicola]|uniref:Hydrogenase maturation factor hoxX like protein n=1 Tax=Venturia nashicola TaxID=86259 RepID=A0A4Z1PJK7_9PEZI|nr:hydrogenase maturation factor hoxX like protein [Venturia nashicola]TLD38064.1 hydrogenase maturation factor hoxX like protein [Venturia nashicola]